MKIAKIEKVALAALLNCFATLNAALAIQKGGREAPAVQDENVPVEVIYLRGGLSNGRPSLIEQQDNERRLMMKTSSKMSTKMTKSMKDKKKNVGGIFMMKSAKSNMMKTKNDNTMMMKLTMMMKDKKTMSMKSKPCYSCTSPPTKRTSVGQTFAAESFLEGLYHEETPGEVSITTDEGINYVVSASLTSRTEGIVSLADAADLISMVTCVDNSTITIVFEDNLDEDEDLEEMFPEGAILVVKEEVFGFCMGNPITSNPIDGEMEYDRNLYQLANEGGDGYLIISSVLRVSSNTVMVKGTRGTFFDMFHEGKIHFQQIKEQDRRQLLPRSLQISDTQEFFKDMLKVEIQVKITDESGFGWANFDFGWWGFEVKIGVAIEFKVTVDVETNVEIGVEVPKSTNPKYIISELLGPPAAKLLTLAKKAGVFNLFGDMPEMKVGVYSELSNYLELAQASLVRPLGPKVQCKLTSGRKELSVDISSQHGVKEVFAKNEKPDNNCTVEMNYGDDVEVRFKLFWAFKPQIMTYLTDMFYFGVALPFGPEIDMKAKVPTPFGPIDDKIGGPILLGDCTTCHHVEAFLTAVMKNPIQVVRLHTPLIDYSSMDEFAGEWEFRKEVLNVCFWRPFGSATVVCGKTCCDGSSSFCEKGRCVPCSSLDRCCGNPDPCCVSSDPCCGKLDKCCGNPDPCCGSTDPLCGVPTCDEEGYFGHCLRSGSACDLPLTSTDCKGNTICCIDYDVPCSSHGYSGSCMDKETCKKDGGVTVSGLCIGPSEIQCCLHDPSVPECTANDVYPGDCRSIDECIGLPDRTPLTPTPEFGCSAGKICCVESPICSSGAAFGTCLHTASCNHQLVVKEKEFLCPGNSFIQCCMELPTCKVDGIQGHCQDKDTCDGTKVAVSNECPGDSEIKCCVELPSCSISGVNGECTPKEACSGLPALSWHDCPGRASNDVSCCLKEKLVCFAPNGETGECGLNCERPAEGSGLCPNGLSCCLAKCDMNEPDVQCCANSDCELQGYVCRNKQCVCEGACPTVTCKVAGIEGECMPSDKCDALPARSWHDCPGRTNNGVACCLAETLVCYAVGGKVGECGTSCSRLAEGSNLCPDGLSCCLEECDPNDPTIDCCEDVDCEQEDFVCNANKCACGQECCSDDDCGDATLFECFENACRPRGCDVTLDDIECCTDSDCNLGLSCEEHNCISNGNPRFTLSWYGDDDLDLHVITPGGVEIWFDMVVDLDSQGRLDVDKIPQNEARWVENIYFSTDGTAPKGSYQYFIQNFNQMNDADGWRLSVYLGEERLRVHTGTTDEMNNSTIFVYSHE